MATSPLVGRQAELGQLRDLLCNPGIRLVTIVGPGGVGKTRLALELAASLQTKFQHDPVFLSLAQLSTPDELLPALVNALGVQLPLGGDLLEAVLEHLEAKPTLVVLDNFEHLIEETWLVHDLLAAAPQVKVLATSREKLNLLEETVYHLAGLELPPLEISDQADQSDAVRLFLQRAQQARPGYLMNAGDLPAIVRICRLVDGMPLGLILAAAWVELFSPQEIADQIEGNLDFLSQELRDLPPRHRSMRAVFDSTFDRLDERLQSVFKKLAVFRAGFTLPAAAAIADADLQALLALIIKSLLWRDSATGRYELHELLRQYASEKLTRNGEYERLRAAHASYYIEFLCQREVQLKSNSQVAALDEIQADFENIRHAWEWAIEERDFAAIQRSTRPLYAFCDMRCRFHEGESLFHLTLQRLSSQSGEPPHPTWAIVLLSWYDLHAYLQKLPSSKEITFQAQSCLALAKAAGDSEGMAASLVLLGAIAEDQGDLQTAIQYYEQGLQIHSVLDDFYWINMRVGLCYQSMGRHQPALESFLTSLQRGQDLGERVKIGWSLINMGDTSVMAGEPRKAEGYLYEALGLFQEIGTPVGVLWANHSLSKLALANGNPELARELAEEASKIARQIHSTIWKERASDLLQQIKRRSASPRSKTGEAILDPLSDRELQVLRLLKSDLSGPEIAQALTVSLNTVRYHTKNIYQKLHVGSRREAIRRADELGL